MGDRGNIAIIQHRWGEPVTPEDRTLVLFYGHWSGSTLEASLASALGSPEGQARRDDEVYLGRIIFDHFTEGANKETGFGISVVVTDNEHPILVVDTKTERVFTVTETIVTDMASLDSAKRAGGFAVMESTIGEPFDEFIARVSATVS